MTNTIQESIKRLKDLQTVAREKDVVLKNAYYDYDRDVLEKRIKKYIKRKDKDIPYTCTNITAKIINRKSMVYKNQAIMEEKKRYNDLIVEKNSVIKIAERHTNLLGRRGLTVFWENDKSDYEVRTEVGRVEMVQFKILIMV